MALPSQILKLDTTVINRIAAGEVIQRPANALKEMLENSLDAKATNIQINVKMGGMKLLQIIDNGTGIRKEDLEIVCERFTTSKLRKFEDLTSINTYGFRGEGLASISHVAHLTIVTKTSSSPCAYKASYLDGKLKGPPKSCAGNQGTQITVEDLFYNLNTRRKALKTTYEEHAKIAEVVGSYAIHNSGVAFSLKKMGETTACIRTQANSSCEENICSVYGNSIARELLDVKLEDEKLAFKMSGHITNANYSTRKLIFLLFINHRLVDSSGIRKIIDQVYGNYLPKGGHPFVYLSLEINPNNVDVNVHPTKHEVFFLHEEEIIGKIQEALKDKLVNCNTSRVFYTQARLMSNKPVSDLKVTDNKSSSEQQISGRPDVAQKQMIRTDSSQQKLQRFLSPDSVSPEKKNKLGEEENEKVKKTLNNTGHPPGWKEVKLTSVLNLQKMIEDGCHSGLRGVFRDHSYVGCVCRGRDLIQHHTNLYLCNTGHLVSELFYQIMIYQFGNFGMIKFSHDIPIYDMALKALDSEESGWTEVDGPKDQLATFIAQLLSSKSDMLLDYFSIQIESGGILKGLPILIEGIFPSFDYLPMWILRLATEVEWEDEEECFRTVSREVSRLYAHNFKSSSAIGELTDSEDEDNDESGNPECRVKKESSSSQMDSQDSLINEAGGSGSENLSQSCSKKKTWKWVVEHNIYPTIQKTLLPPKHFANDGTVLQLASLPDLYKVFERC